MSYYQAMKRHRGNLNAYTKWKKPIWKGYILYDSNPMTFWKRQNYKDNKKISSYQGLRGGKDEEVEHKGFLGQWNYSVWHSNGKYLSLRIHPNPENPRHKAWTLIYTVDLS